MTASRTLRTLRTILLAAACLVLAASSHAFKTPERLEYQLLWGVLKVGDATLSAEEAGPGALHLTMTARSNMLVDLLYKVRNRIKATVASDFSKTFRYHKDLYEGGEARSFTSTFDWTALHAQQTGHNATGPYALAPSPIVDGVLDPLGVFYALRTLPSDADANAQSLRRLASDGRRTEPVLVELLGRETVDVPAGTFTAQRARVTMRGLDGVFRVGRRGAFSIWVTDDDARVPLKIDSQIVVAGIRGRMRAELKALPD